MGGAVVVEVGGSGILVEKGSYCSSPASMVQVGGGRDHHVVNNSTVFSFTEDFLYQVFSASEQALLWRRRVPVRVSGGLGWTQKIFGFSFNHLRGDGHVSHKLWFLSWLFRGRM